jgi:hypothetical protein
MAELSLIAGRGHGSQAPAVALIAGNLANVKESILY